MSPLGNFKMLRQFEGLLTDREAGDWSSSPVTGRRRWWAVVAWRAATCLLTPEPGGGPAQTSCSFWGLGLELGKQASHPATHSQESRGLRRFG